MQLKRSKKLFITEHEHYYTPGDYYSKYLLEKDNVSNVDISIEVFQEFCRFFFHDMVESKDYIDSYYHSNKLDDEGKKELSMKEPFFKHLEILSEKIPGYTPIEKAINLIHIINEKNEKDGKPQPQKGRSKSQSQDEKENQDQGGEGEGENGEPQSGIGRHKSQDEKRMEEFMYKVNMDKIEEVIPDKEIFHSKTANLLIKNDKNLTDYKKKMKFMRRIAIIEGLGKSFEIKKTTLEKKVYNSDKHAHRRMTEFAELESILLYQRLLPHFSAKLAIKDLIINSPVKTEESKQKIIMLVDFSGSMSSYQKQDWVKAVLADRLMYAIKEECEIFFSFFLTEYELDHKTFKFTHIYNEKTALDFWKNFNDQPSGGDTEIGKIIEKIRIEIEDNHKLFNLDIDLSKEKPEILVINDGKLCLDI